MNKNEEQEDRTAKGLLGEYETLNELLRVDKDTERRMQEMLDKLDKPSVFAAFVDYVLDLGVAYAGHSICIPNVKYSNLDMMKEQLDLAETRLDKEYGGRN